MTVKDMQRGEDGRGTGGHKCLLQHMEEREEEQRVKKGAGPSDEEGQELIATREREEREELTMKEREVERDWCLLFSCAGNSHRGVGSHGNSSLDSCVHEDGL